MLAKHFRVIYGSVTVSNAPHLNAGPYGALVPAPQVAQVHVVSQLPLQRARFQLPITVILHLMAHYRFDRQIFGGTPGKQTSCILHSFSLHSAESLRKPINMG